MMMDRELTVRVGRTEKTLGWLLVFASNRTSLLLLDTLCCYGIDSDEFLEEPATAAAAPRNMELHAWSQVVRILKSTMNMQKVYHINMIIFNTKH